MRMRIMVVLEVERKDVVGEGDASASKKTDASES